MSKLIVGTVGSPAMLGGDIKQRQSLVSMVQQSSIDHLFIADHVSFHNGLGMDGMVNAATLAAMAPDIDIFIGVYLLALRHPVTVARQLSSLSLSAPARITLGVGIGGEDRHEMEVCGVNPAKRGKHTNHSLQALRALMSGEPVSYECEFFEFEEALIKPAPTPAIPLVIGGRSAAAIKRAALLGDGWLGVWCSPTRFEAVLTEIDEMAATRAEIPAWRHGMQIWTGFGETTDDARSHLAKGMEDMYKVPFEKFEKYSPYGTPSAVAEFLIPYIAAGARILNLAPRAPSEEMGIECIAEVTDILKKEFPELT